MGIFSGRHYPREVILWAVRWYCRYGISYRELEEMLTERGVAVDHTTIYRWVQKYGPELDKQTRWYRRFGRWGADSWRVDETYIRIGGKWCYLYRAVTKRGDTLDFYLSTRRSTASAKRFLAKTLRSAKQHGAPRVICTDKNPALAAAITALKAEGKCPPEVEHRRSKYCNNIIEGDHGRLKRILGPKAGRPRPAPTEPCRAWKPCTPSAKAKADYSPTVPPARTRSSSPRPSSTCRAYSTGCDRRLFAACSRGDLPQIATAPPQIRDTGLPEIR